MDMMIPKTNSAKHENNLEINNDEVETTESENETTDDENETTDDESETTDDESETTDDESETTDEYDYSELIGIAVTVNGIKTYAVIDTDAAGCSISLANAIRCGLEDQIEPRQPKPGNHNDVFGIGEIMSCKLEMGALSLNWKFTVDKGLGMVIGNDILQLMNAKINKSEQLLMLNYQDKQVELPLVEYMKMWKEKLDMETCGSLRATKVAVQKWKSKKEGDSNIDLLDSENETTDEDNDYQKIGIEVTINGTKIYAMIDTGAAGCSISLVNAIRCGLEDQIEPRFVQPSIGFHTAVLNIGEIMSCKLEMGALSLNWKFRVGEGPAGEMLIGTDILQLMNAKIYYSKRLLILNYQGKKIQLPLINYEKMMKEKFDMEIYRNWKATKLAAKQWKSKKDCDFNIDLLDRKWAEYIARSNKTRNSGIHRNHVFVYVNGVSVCTLVDSGAWASLISESMVKKCGLAHLVDWTFTQSSYGIEGASESIGLISKCKLIIGKSEHFVDLHVEKLPDDKLVLGTDSLDILKAEIDYEKFEICLHFEGNRKTTLSMVERDHSEKKLGHVELFMKTEKLGFVKIAVDGIKGFALIDQGRQRSYISEKTWMKLKHSKSAFVPKTPKNMRCKISFSENNDEIHFNLGIWADSKHDIIIGQNFLWKCYIDQSKRELCFMQGKTIGRTSIFDNEELCKIKEEEKENNCQMNHFGLNFELN